MAAPARLERATYRLEGVKCLAVVGMIAVCYESPPRVCDGRREAVAARS